MRSITLLSERMTSRTSDSVSIRNARRRFSSKSGKARRSGFTPSRFRRYSHCDAKFVTRLSLRWSASMRSICSPRVFLSLSKFCSARSSKTSSGPLLQRKNDKREASSVSLMRWSPDCFDVRSNRNRKFGFTRIEAMPRSIPNSKVSRHFGLAACVIWAFDVVTLVPWIASLKNRNGNARSSSSTARRYARRNSGVKILRAASN